MTYNLKNQRKSWLLWETSLSKFFLAKLQIRDKKQIKFSVNSRLNSYWISYNDWYLKLTAIGRVSRDYRLFKIKIRTEVRNVSIIIFRIGFQWMCHKLSQKSDKNINKIWELISFFITSLKEILIFYCNYNKLQNILCKIYKKQIKYK